MLPVGRSVVVRVPATSANLGPGFDCFGLALDWYDTITLEVTDAGFVADVAGEGASEVPTDESHLVLSSALRVFRELGVEAPGLKLTANNTIPHGRGLGSSSAAIVSGLAAAAALCQPGAELDRHWLVGLADEIEGHPDNVAAATVGGFVLAYGNSSGLQVTSGTVQDQIEAALFIPETPVATKMARGLLPATVPLADAAMNAGRAALLVQALAANPDLLLDATRDWLHQDYRSPAMPASADLLKSLRNKGFAGVISGAGPTVLVLGRKGQLDALSAIDSDGFRTVRAGIGGGVEVLSLSEGLVTPASQ